MVRHPKQRITLQLEDISSIFKRMVLIPSTFSCNILITRVWLFAEQEGWWSLKASIWKSLCPEILLCLKNRERVCMWEYVCRVMTVKEKEGMAWWLPPFTFMYLKQWISTETLWYNEHEQCHFKNHVTKYCTMVPYFCRGAQPSSVSLLTALGNTGRQSPWHRYSWSLGGYGPQRKEQARAFMWCSGIRLSGRGLSTRTKTNIRENM